MNQPQNGQFDDEDSFDRFFRPAGRQNDVDSTDPGVPAGGFADQATQQRPVASGTPYFQQPSQGSGYTQPVQQGYAQQPYEPQKGRSAVVPLVVLGISLLVIAVVGYLFVSNSGSSGNAQNSMIPTSAGGSSNSDGSSNGSSDSASPSSSTLSYASLPPDTGNGCSNSYTTTSGVTCQFGDLIKARAQTVAEGATSAFTLTSPVNHRPYDVSCNHLTGSYIDCQWIGTDGSTAHAYVLPQG